MDHVILLNPLSNLCLTVPTSQLFLYVKGFPSYPTSTIWFSSINWLKFLKVHSSLLLSLYFSFFEHISWKSPIIIHSSLHSLFLSLITFHCFFLIWSSQLAYIPINHHSYLVSGTSTSASIVKADWYILLILISFF